MRKVLVLCAALAGLLATGGCFSYDPAHNQSHWSMIKNDLRIIHEDIDFMLGFDAPSHASRTQY